MKKIFINKKENRMSKISFIYTFFVFNYTLFLCGAEQQILQLHKEVSLPADVTAVGFNKHLPFIAYASRGANNTHTTVEMYDTNENAVVGSQKIAGNANVLCFNDRACDVGLLTNNGVVLINWQHESVEMKNESDCYYSALHFNEGHCYAGTSIGQLYELQPGQQAELVCHMPHGDFGTHYKDKHPYCSSVAFDDINKRVGLAGKSVIDQGLYFVFNEDNSHHASFYCNDGTLELMTQSCFDPVSGLLYAVAAGKLLIIDNMKDAGKRVNPNMHTKWFKYDSPVTQLCFDGTDKRLFVGLENGEVYLSKLKNAGHLNHPDYKSTLLLQWEHPIQALSFNAAENMLGIATLYKAALFRYFADK